MPTHNPREGRNSIMECKRRCSVSPLGKTTGVSTALYRKWEYHGVTCRELPYHGGGAWPVPR